MLWQFLIAVLVAVISSVITFHLAFRRFVSEKWWERKAEVYASILECLHTMERSYSELSDEAGHSRHLSEDRKAKLQIDAGEASDKLHMLAAVWQFAMPPTANTCLSKAIQGLRDARSQESWFEFLEAKWLVMDVTIKELHPIVHEDLAPRRFWSP